MNLRGYAVLVILCAVLLLGAASATWAEVTTTSTFDDAGAVIERTEPTSGAELAGGLYAIGLAGIALAGPLVRWRRTGIAVVVAGLAGLAVVATAWPSQGEVTAAPSIAGAASLALCVLGALALRPATSSPRAGTSSRYTVEAVRGEATPADADEWDLAVLDDDPDGHDDLPEERA